MEKQKASRSNPLREWRIRRSTVLGVSDSKKEHLQSHRVEYTSISLAWRFVTIARGLLSLTAAYALTNAMNGVRLHYLKIRYVTFTEFAGEITGTVQFADDTIERLAGAGIIAGIGIVFWIVDTIDRELGALQLQCVERGLECESVLGLRNGIFRRAHEHRRSIQVTFYLAKLAFALVCCMWVYFAYTVSK